MLGQTRKQKENIFILTFTKNRLPCFTRDFRAITHFSDTRRLLHIKASLPFGLATGFPSIDFRDTSEKRKTHWG